MQKYKEEELAKLSPEEKQKKLEREMKNK